MKGQLTTCRLCGAEGRVHVGRQLSGGRWKVEDNIPHEEGCELYKGSVPRHLKKKAWRSQEKRANALVGARDTIASGAAGEDGDGRLFHQWRVESKGTDRYHYNLRQDTWAKLVRGALRAGEEPLLHVEIRGGLSTSRMVVIRADLYHSIRPEKVEIDPTRQNRVSWHVAYSESPVALGLDPVAIVVTEPDFEQMMRKMKDEASREDL